MEVPTVLVELPSEIGNLTCMLQGSNQSILFIQASFNLLFNHVYILINNYTRMKLESQYKQIDPKLILTLTFCRPTHN